MRVAIYARVSTTDQKCENQVKELSKYVERMGWELVSSHIDTGFSGSKATRPALDELMKLVAKRQIDVICCTKIDRFGRSVLNLKLSLDALQRSNVRFIAIDQGIDTDKSNPVGRLLLNILASLAEFELELITERRTLGIQKAKEKGVQFGRPKAIFRRDLAIEHRQAGMSLRQIAKLLDTNLAAVQRELDSKGVSKPALPQPIDNGAIQAA